MVADCRGCEAKDVFIDYLTDEVSQLKAQLRELMVPSNEPSEAPDWNKFREHSIGYKSIRQRIRHAVELQNKKKQASKEEDKYEKVEVNDSTN